MPANIDVTSRTHSANAAMAKQETKPLLSIGLPVYNGLPYLEASIRSLLASDFRDFELIVCDNASTDGTGDVVQALAAEDDRIRYVRNEQNIGAARNYNKSLELARGTYFRWAAADDLITPGVLSKCIEVLENDPAVLLAFPQTRLIDGEGNLLGDYDDGDGWGAESPVERFRFSLTRWGLSNTMFGVIRRDILIHADLQGNYPASDLVMQSSLAIRGKFVQVRGEYYFRRMHAGATDSLDPVSLAQFYDPGRDRAFQAKLPRLFRELLGVIRRAPVSRADRMRMRLALLRRAYWMRKELARELKMVIRRSSSNRASR